MGGKRLAIRVIALLALAPATLSAQTPQRLSGTYAMWICDKACSPRDTATSSQYGFIVLDDYGLDLGRIPVAARTRIHRRSWYGVPLGQINACYSFQERHPKHLTNPGDTPTSHGLSNWNRKGDSVYVGLGATPDSWYTMYSVQKGDALTGIGWVLGMSGTHYSHQQGFIVARRVGAPDASKCFPDKLVKQCESDSSRLDGDELTIMRVLERRDEGMRTRSAGLAASAYQVSAMITDPFGAMHGFRKPVLSYFDSTLASSQENPIPRRRDWPRIQMSGEMAYVEEYFETTEPASTTNGRPVVQRGHRISILDKSDRGWQINREITLDERD